METALGTTGLRGHLQALRVPLEGLGTGANLSTYQARILNSLVNLAREEHPDERQIQSVREPRHTAMGQTDMSRTEAIESLHVLEQIVGRSR